MKMATQFWPMMKHEMGLGQGARMVGPASAIVSYCFFLGVFPWVSLYGNYTAHGNITAMFEVGFLPIMAFLFLGGLTLWVPWEAVPALSQLLQLPDQAQDTGRWEFLFTRAADRRTLFRARAVTFYLIAAAPLLCNVVISPFFPDLVASPDLAMEWKYRLAFPGFNPGITSPHQVGLPHGAILFTAWLALLATFVFITLQSYAVWIARRVKGNSWWTLIFPAAPLLAVTLVFILVQKRMIHLPFNFFEDSFLFFATHPFTLTLALAGLIFVLQKWCEQQFSRLEID